VARISLVYKSLVLSHAHLPESENMDYVLVWSLAPLVVVAACYFGRRIEQANAAARNF